ncbi:DNA alkylation repair protein [Lactobacillus xujianguonis]|uniref:DNA alkylation repair protein n=1 Tax=Lactobacillus xujianguonis TaxID=2495899 RepID=UPI000FDB9E5F|nr:DNA alkylation repair protein [Lactobacillus xujianguonis]RVU77628.1 DNA alkylation repair protein [Lactobacillus xujianguonis]
MELEELKVKFGQKVNLLQAKQLASYMRNQFSFYGLHTPERRLIYHDFLLAEKKSKQINWKLLNEAWQEPEREMQYFVCDYLIAMKKYFTFEEMARIESFVRTKQWWDTIDSLIKPIGDLGLRDKRVDGLMLKWSVDPDIWVRRVAIEHQLLRKEKMNTDLLKKILKNNLNSQEFFINKAIGWALRDYSKTNPDWVRDFIAENCDEMAKLSITEGSKYL